MKKAQIVRYYLTSGLIGCSNKANIKGACSTVTTSCVNELTDELGDMMTADGNYHYQLEWESDDGATTSFEFIQQNDPFTEEEDEVSLTMAEWGGDNILDDTDFLQTFKKVRQKVFRWLEYKFDISKDDLSVGRTTPLGSMMAPRETVDEAEMDEELDFSFDDFITEINEEFGLGSFEPVVVQFDKAKPTQPTTTTTRKPFTGTTNDVFKCKPGWIKLDGSWSCFVMKTTGGINWHSARATCSAEQGVSSHLVRIDSEAANNHISRSASGKIWIGVTDETSENTWTDTLGKPITFFKWSADEPNDKDGEDCVYTNEDDKAEWNDKDCNHDKVKHFACQYDLPCQYDGRLCDAHVCGQCSNHEECGPWANTGMICSNGNCKCDEDWINLDNDGTNGCEYYRFGQPAANTCSDVYENNPQFADQNMICFVRDKAKRIHVIFTTEALREANQEKIIYCHSGYRTNIAVDGFNGWVLVYRDYIKVQICQYNPKGGLAFTSCRFLTKAAQSVLEGKIIDSKIQQELQDYFSRLSSGW